NMRSTHSDPCRNNGLARGLQFDKRDPAIALQATQMMTEGLMEEGKRAQIALRTSETYLERNESSELMSAECPD
ncbi:hypothetical protein H0H81_005736, partial [Sphagnurus paluster]